LENQLKALMKAIDTVVAQRKGLAEAAGDFSASLHALAAVELSPILSGPLEGLSELQLRIRELYERQAQQDVLTLGITIDEYIRLIGSIKTAFSQRQKSFHSWHAAEAELQKRRHTQEKLLRQGKSQQDRINQINADVADAERKVHQTRLLFEDMGRLMRNELERFEKEKVEDFKSGVETFLEGAVEAQKEVCYLTNMLWKLNSNYCLVDRTMGELLAATRRRRRREPIVPTPGRESWRRRSGSGRI
jgi:sorting nexin-1/2